MSVIYERLNWGKLLVCVQVGSHYHQHGYAYTTCIVSLTIK